MHEHVDLSALQAVIFDVDGTLYRQKPVRRAMVFKLVAAHVWHPRRGVRTFRVIGAYRRAQEVMRNQAVRGDLASEQLRVTATETGVDLDEVQQCITRWMDQAPLPLIRRFAQPDLVESLLHLRAMGLRLAVLSDYPCGAKLDALGIAHLFDHVLCAQDEAIGTFKPDPRGLEVALERMRLSAPQVVYVGDRPEVDAVSAAAANVACVIVHRSPGRDGDSFRTTSTLREITTILEST